MGDDPLGILTPPKTKKVATNSDPLGILQKKNGGNDATTTLQPTPSNSEVQLPSQNGNGIRGTLDAASKIGAEVNGNNYPTYNILQTPQPKQNNLPQYISSKPTIAPVKEVSPLDFTANAMGVNKEDFVPNKIYNNAANIIRNDINNNPQITAGEGNNTIEHYLTQRNADIGKQQQDIVGKLGEEFSGFAPDKEKIDAYKNQIGELEKEKQDLKLYGNEVNQVQSAKQTPIPTDPSKQTDYFREIGRNVNRINDPTGIANQEYNLVKGTNGTRDKELVDTENFSNEQAGIEAKKKQLEVDFGNGNLSKEDYDTQSAVVKAQEGKLLSNNPGAKTVMDRNSISKIIEENRNKESNTPQDAAANVAGSLFHDIINYNVTDNDVSTAVKQYNVTAKERGYATISPDEEKKFIADKSQIPGTSSFGNLFNSTLVSTATSLNYFNPFISDQEKEKEKYGVEKIFTPTQRQTEGVLGGINQVVNTVGQVAKWATLGKFLGGAAAGAATELGVGGETIGGIDASLGGIKTLTTGQEANTGLALTAGLLIYPDAKEEAKKFTTDESEQNMYAATKVMINTLAFGALNPSGIVNGILGKLGKSDFSKELLKVVDESGGINKLTPETFKTTIFNAAKKFAGADVNAATTMGLLNAADQATDVMFGKKQNVDFKEVMNTTVNAALVFAPMSLMQGVMGARADKNKNNVTIQLINQAAKDPMAFKDYMDNAVQDGRVSQEDANKKIQIVNTSAVLRASKDLPQHLSEENKATYVDNLRQEITLNQEIKDGVTDPLLLKDKEEQIKVLQEERRIILNPPIVDAKIESSDVQKAIELFPKPNESKNPKGKVFNVFDKIASKLFGQKTLQQDYDAENLYNKKDYEKKIEVLKANPELAKYYHSASDGQRESLDSYITTLSESDGEVKYNPDDIRQFHNVRHDGTVLFTPKGLSLKISDFENVPRTNDGNIDFNNAKYEIIGADGKVIKEDVNRQESGDLLIEENKKYNLESKNPTDNAQPENISQPVEKSGIENMSDEEIAINYLDKWEHKNWSDTEITNPDEAKKIIEKKKQEILQQEKLPDDIKSFVDRIKSGEKMTTPEDLQFYENNATKIEQQLKPETKVERTQNEIDDLKNKEFTSNEYIKKTKFEDPVTGKEESLLVRPALEKLRERHTILENLVICLTKG